MKTVLEVAQHLIDARYAYEGDHGFEGFALDAWKTMREGYLNLLQTIAAGNIPSSDQLEARQARCPQDVAAGFGGTRAGATWAAYVREVTSPYAAYVRYPDDYFNELDIFEPVGVDA